MKRKSWTATCNPKKLVHSLTSHTTINSKWFNFSSVAQLSLTLRDSMNCSTPGLPVHHQLPEFTQTHVHWVSNAIQPSHPLSSPSPSVFPSIRNESAIHFRRPKDWSFSFNTSKGRVEWPRKSEQKVISARRVCRLNYVGIPKREEFPPH